MMSENRIIVKKDGVVVEGRRHGTAAQAFTWGAEEFIDNINTSHIDGVDPFKTMLRDHPGLKHLFNDYARFVNSQMFDPGRPTLQSAKMLINYFAKKIDVTVEYPVPRAQADAQAEADSGDENEQAHRPGL